MYEHNILIITIYRRKKLSRILVLPAVYSMNMFRLEGGGRLILFTAIDVERRSKTRGNASIIVYLRFFFSSRRRNPKMTRVLRRRPSTRTVDVVSCAVRRSKHRRRRR